MERSIIVIQQLYYDYPF